MPTAIEVPQPTQPTPAPSISLPAARLERAARAARSRRRAFWLLVAVQAVFVGASNFPTPLFPIWADRYGFGALTVTVLFAIYVAALVPSILTLGRASDRFGRRPTVVAGMALTGVSSLVFAATHGVAWLAAGEILYGIAGGLIMSATPVAIRELHPRGDIAAAALATTVALAVGLALGPLVSGVLASVGPGSTATPFVVHAVLAAALTVALLRIPETAPPRDASAAAPPIVQVPDEIRTEFVTLALAGAVPWMVAGWFFSLSPTFLHSELGVHLTQPAIAGFFAAVMIGANGMSQLALRRYHASIRARHLGLVGMAVGIALVALSSPVGSLALAVLGAVVAGFSGGVVQFGTMARIQAIAPDHARGGVTSAFITICYLALALPVVAAGFAADHTGLVGVTAWYVAAVALLVAVAVGWGRRRARLDALVPCPA